MTTDRQLRILTINDSQEILELLQELLQEEGYQVTSSLAHLLILCTAAVQTVRNDEMAEKLRQLDVRIVLKPFKIDELLAVLSEVLSERTCATKWVMQQ
jgi:DNA-binding response OmpR family regulator